MDIRLVFYNSFDKRENFEMKSGSRHWHAILILKEGKISFETNGETCVAGKDEIAFFPGETFMRRQVIEPISFHQMAFFVSPDHPYFQHVSAGVFHLPKNHVRCISETLDQLRYHAPESNKSDVYCNLLNQILMEDVIFGHEEGQNSQTLDNSVYEAIRYIKNHLHEKIGIPDIAAHVHLSNVGLIWKFNHYLGCTPSEMVLNLRMQQAKYLLLETRKPIKEIAAMCGYSNPFYFSKVFHQFFHSQPSKYVDKITSIDFH